jgi:hypothetical protein
MGINSLQLLIKTFRTGVFQKIEILYFVFNYRKNNKMNQQVKMYYKPPSIEIEDFNNEISKGDLWYIIEHCEIGKIYDIVIENKKAIIHFAMNNNVSDEKKEIYEHFEKGGTYPIYYDEIHYWNAKKHVENSFIIDFENKLYPNVTDNRYYRNIMKI